MTGAQCTNNKACRIVVADDHAIMRDGLAAILGSDGNVEIVATADDGKAAIEEVDRHLPDLVLMDLSMPRTDGAQAISVIKRKHPEVRVVVLTFHKDDSHIHAALTAGADAYVLKDDGRDELLAAVAHVRAGRHYLSPAICDRVVSGYVSSMTQPEPKVTSWSTLTRREREVLKLIAEGYKTPEIADYLSLSIKTDEKHRSSLMRKLDLHGVSGVTAYAIEYGLL